MSPSIPTSSMSSVLANPALLSKVCSVLRANFPAAAESMRQSAALSACRRALIKGQQEEVVNVLGYVITNAYYRMVDRLHKQGKVHLVPDPEDLPQLLEAGPCSPEQALMEAELRQVLVQTQEHLKSTLQNDTERTMFTLLVRKFLGQERTTFADIAAEVGCAEHSVRRFWQKLRTAWGELLEEWHVA